MKKIFFIDFENVGLNGLIGIEYLGEDDCVLIFSGQKSPKLSLEDANRIYNSAVKVDIYINSLSRKNAIDFIISSYLGYYIGTNAYDSYSIISKDKGYEPAISAIFELTSVDVSLEKDIISVIDPDGLITPLNFSITIEDKKSNKNELYNMIGSFIDSTKKDSSKKESNKKEIETDDNN